MKIICWNVNGVRAVVKKGFEDMVKTWDADIICLQETKAQDDQVQEALKALDGYYVYSNSAVRKGYSGTAVITKHEPLKVSYGIGKEVHDQEGRVITVEFEKYYLVTAYIPNSGNALVRLDYRQTWDTDFRNYLNKLQKKKPVIACGDFNVAHKPIDLARPKENYNKTSGYTQAEIDGLEALINVGFVDTFRHFKPEVVAYSWWSARFGAREKNIGWRIDYFLVSQPFMAAVEDSYIMPDQMGSDHCPIGLTLKGIG